VSHSLKLKESKAFGLRVVFRYLNTGFFETAVSFTEAAYLLDDFPGRSNVLALAFRA